MRTNRRSDVRRSFVDITFELRNGLMHDYPIFFFLPEAGADRPSIYRALLAEDSSVEAIASVRHEA